MGPHFLKNILSVPRVIKYQYVESNLAAQTTSKTPIHNSRLK
jgi:hypothetical protein